jgi:hypothetical protein
MKPIRKPRKMTTEINHPKFNAKKAQKYEFTILKSHFEQLQKSFHLFYSTSGTKPTIHVRLYHEGRYGVSLPTLKAMNALKFDCANKMYALLNEDGMTTEIY